MDNTEQLISLAAKFHGIDVPVMAIREESGTVIITVQGGKELRCKFHDLMDGGAKATPTAAARPPKKSAAISQPPPQNLARAKRAPAKK